MSASNRPDQILVHQAYRLVALKNLIAACDTVLRDNQAGSSAGRVGVTTSLKGAADVLPLSRRASKRRSTVERLMNRELFNIVRSHREVGRRWPTVSVRTLERLGEEPIKAVRLGAQTLHEQTSEAFQRAAAKSSDAKTVESRIIAAGAEYAVKTEHDPDRCALYIVTSLPPQRLGSEPLLG